MLSLISSVNTHIRPTLLPKKAAIWTRLFPEIDF